GRVRGTTLDDLIHGLGDHSVVEDGRIRVTDVIHDGFGPRTGEGLDPVGEVLGTVRRGVEGQVGAGCEVVDDFEHGPAFVLAAAAVLQDIDLGREIAGLLRVGQPALELVDRVGEDADGDPLPVEARVRTKRVGLEDPIALGG